MRRIVALGVVMLAAVSSVVVAQTASNAVPGPRTYQVCEQHRTVVCATWSFPGAFMGAEGQGVWENGETANLRWKSGGERFSVEALFTSGPRARTKMAFDAVSVGEGYLEGSGKGPSGLQHVRVRLGSVSEKQMLVLRWQAPVVPPVHLSASNHTSLPPEVELAFAMSPLTLASARGIQRPAKCDESSPYGAQQVSMIGSKLEEAMDFERALCWLQIGAAKGDQNAEFLLGRMYLFGRAVPVNYPLALKWSVAAAKQDNTSAYRLLSYIFSSGKGVTVDRTFSAELLAQAKQIEGRGRDTGDSVDPGDIRAAEARTSNRVWWDQHNQRVQSEGR